MFITDAFLGEHGVFHAMIGHIEQTLADDPDRAWSLPEGEAGPLPHGAETLRKLESFTSSDWERVGKYEEFGAVTLTPVANRRKKN
ncbi:MAG TPA: hypothetical protein PLM89_04720 [Anaerolineales bacterium]|nr:hypothetical protein [Anaerolineales bacterium]